MNDTTGKSGYQQDVLPPNVKLDGDRVKQIREAKGLTQLYVATSVGVTTDTISRWENRRYPSIKRENALRLAETLEVDILEILEDMGPSDSEEEPDSRGEREETPQGKEEHAAPATGPYKGGFFSRTVVSCILISLVLLGLLAYLYFGSRNQPLEISARRILPRHSACGQTFPVIIQVSIEPIGSRSLIVRDGSNAGILVLRGMPRFASRDEHSVKWIYQGRIGTAMFMYLVRMDKKAKTGTRFCFNGQVTIRASKTISVVIGGNDKVEVSPYHWADTNSDLKIDDEEILNAYDLLSGINGAEKALKQVETIWAAGGYRWDPKTQDLLPVERP